MAGGANPFLIMGGDDYSSPPANNSNPFLMDSTDFSSGPPFCENPFLSQPAAPVTNMTSTGATNPFAFDAMDYDPPEATQVEIQPALPNQTNDIFGEAMIVEADTLAQTPMTTIDFFSIDNETTNLNNIEPVVAVQKPDILELRHTNTVSKMEDNMNVYSSDEEIAKTIPKRPPPPPRPVVPPSKETQDLIMSVTGAMDATSSHLLDRIPPTRSPSPVSMRDLHSPSPTPETVFAEFLDVSNSKAQTVVNPEVDFFDVNDSNDIKNTVSQDLIQPQTAENFMNLINDPIVDINQNHSQQLTEEQLSPTLPQAPQSPRHPISPVQTPPSISAAPPAVSIPLARSQPQIPPTRPPPARPLPPQKPLPPARRPSPPKPERPPVPTTAPQVLRKQSQPSDDMMMLGDETMSLTAEQHIEKPVASTADIMSLYSTPPVVSKPEPIMDLLCETTDVNNSMIIQEVSTDTSQQDMKMDTTDTQNKASASSITFNPFSAEEKVISAVVDISPVNLQIDNFRPDTNIFAKPHETNNDNFTTQNEPHNNMFVPEDDIFNKQDIENKYSQKCQGSPTNLSSEGPQNTNLNIKTSIDVEGAFEKHADVFDDFAAKFESAANEDSKNGFDPFGGNTNSAWGNDAGDSGFATGFDADEPFDAFLSLQEPPAVPQHTPSILSKRESQESDEDKDFSVFIKPKNINQAEKSDMVMPVLAPPPKSPVQNALYDTSPRLNPFDQQNDIIASATEQLGLLPSAGEFVRSDSQETPPTPLFDEDVSQPLENFPRTMWNEDGWEMQLRQPNKKKITGQRFWKKIFVKLTMHEDCPILQLFNLQTDKDPFQELPLQPCYSVSEIGAQQYDNYGKIFTLKLQYIFYKERPGVRPGQVTKAERITNKLSQFAAYAIQGDYQGVKEFGSDLKKLGLPVEHAPQVSQLLKLGSLNYEDMKQFSVTIEEHLFRLSAHRDRALHYKMEEVQITAVDELYVEQNFEGHVEKQIARVRLFFLGFLSGMPDIELGVNDMRRQGKEVVGRHDIIPVVTEEWIRLDEAVEFHSCVQQDEHFKTHIIKFKPPDACYIELMRFRIRPPKNRELPLQLKPVMCITGNKVEIRADCLVPGFASRKLGQVPCEDVMIRIPIPECWIYLFRVEKHFRYGSVKSAHRRTGKIKGIERFLGTVDTLQESLIEVTSGQAKYEHQHRAIVWRIPRLPKEGQGAYTTHNLVCRLALTSYDQIPDQLAEFCYVEFTMPATQASHMTVRSVSLQNSQSDDPPEKYVRYLARHEYRVGIEHTEGEDPNAYAAATMVNRKPAPVEEEQAPPVAVVAEESSSDSE